MRIFIGVKLNETVHQKIETFLKPFKKAGTPIRWVKPENVHITLKFIGEVPKDKYLQIEKQLSNLDLAVDSMDIKLTGCGKFGKQDTLNIFWIGLEPNPLLNRLYDLIEESLNKIGIEKESRPFKPHITVGRNKRNYNFKGFYETIADKSDQPIAEFTVSHFQVFKSDLKPEGPIYTILKEIPLKHG